MTAIVMQGDARSLPLPDESVDLVVTSPPYFGQRDYRDGGESLAGQIGAEATPREYIAALLECTVEWMRVLKPEGSIWVNLDDAYYSGKGAPGKTTTDPKNAGRNARRTTRSPLDYGLDLPRKTLIGLPWRYAIGCIDDLGLTLRAGIAWTKNGLPESVTDRCQKTHEYLFHLVKQPRYYAACDEIREPHAMRPQRRPGGHKARQALGVLPAQTFSTSQRDEAGVDGHPLGKIPGSVWEIPTEPLVVPPRIAHARCCGGAPRHGCEDGLAHHAAFPTALPRRIILGWSPPGICTACGEGRRPVTSTERISLRRNDVPGRALLNNDAVHGADRRAGTHAMSQSLITGYACACPDASAPTRRALVLDPFGGTGTTALVADVLGRDGISVDASGDYCDLALWRTADPAERAKALQVPKPPAVIDGQLDMLDLFGATA